jgi:hypothetical protein
MSAGDVPSLDVPNSNAESRLKEEAQQTGENLPIASTPWSEIDLSFLLSELDHQANEHVPSSPQRDEFGGDSTKSHALALGAPVARTGSCECDADGNVK